MNKRRSIVVLCVMFLATGALAIGKKAGLAPFTAFSRRVEKGDLLEPHNTVLGQPQSQTSQNNLSQPQSADVPKHVVYDLLFRQMTAFKKKADDDEGHGKNSAFLRSYHKNKAKLNDQQGAVLEKVAADYHLKVAKLDNQAKKIIDAERKRHPQSKLGEGEQIPLLPMELKSLSQQRVNLILQSRDQLHAALGDAEFQRFDDFVQQDIASKLKPVQSDPIHHQ